MTRDGGEETVGRSACAGVGERGVGVGDGESVYGLRGRMATACLVYAIPVRFF
jgi:hypothetical protein